MAVGWGGKSGSKSMWVSDGNDNSSLGLAGSVILRAARRTLEGVDVLAWDSTSPPSSSKTAPQAKEHPTTPMPRFDALSLAA